MRVVDITEASAAYVEQLFDEYAASFDAAADALGYRVPHLLEAAVSSSYEGAGGSGRDDLGALSSTISTSKISESQRYSLLVQYESNVAPLFILLKMSRLEMEYICIRGLTRMHQTLLGSTSHRLYSPPPIKATTPHPRYLFNRPLSDIY